MENVMAEREAAEVVLDMNEEPVFSYMCKMLDAHKSAREPRARPCTIYKVPDEIKKKDPGAYEPQIVSIGPLHRGNPKLLPMEGIKWQFLLNLIGRDPSNSLDKYINAVSNPSFVQEIAECYSVQVIGADGVNAFVVTMVLDGCFIIEYFLKASLGDSVGEPVVGNRNRSPVENDLLLMENQIPFCVLQILFDSTSSPELHDCQRSLTELAMFCLARDRYDSLSPIPQVIHHLLHLRYTRCLRTLTDASQSRSVKQVETSEIEIWSALLRMYSCILSGFGWAPLEARVPIASRSATELYKAGITFKPKRTYGSMLEVTFRASDGVMEIPPLLVRAVSISELRNMVALEHLLPAVGNQFISFADMMDTLVDTPADVDILMTSGVLMNGLDTREEVAHFFNTLSKGAFLRSDERYMTELLKDVTEYCADPRHRFFFWKKTISKGVVSYIHSNPQ